MEMHVFSYSHDGKRWEVEIPAKDAADARARIGKLAYATYDGVQIAKVPAQLGLLAKLATWLQNTTRRDG